MADELIILDGTTFFYSDADGNVGEDDQRGYFFQDVRHLSRWELRLAGRQLDCLTSRAVDYYSARVLLAASGDPSVTVRRDRFVTEGTHEDVVVTNHSEKTQELEVELRFASDFADVMQVNGGEPLEGGTTSADVEDGGVRLSFERDGYRRETIVRFSEHAAQLESGQALFRLRLEPREEWKTCVDVIAVSGGEEAKPLLGCDSFGKPEPEMPLSLADWLEQAPEIETSWDALRRTYRHSLIDLASLRVRPNPALEHAMPAGGIPWFMTVFGRDSIVAAYEALPFRPTLAEATLREMAGLQATEDDPFRDAEPGKIMHELRRGTLAKLGIVPHSPYYGTHDATQLFLILLDEYERWTGDADLVHELEEPARAALGWIDGPADRDGDGYLEYQSRSAKGLEQHGWKDSDDSIQFEDGRMAEFPIATCEVQAYTYDAWLRVARLVREFWNDEDLAERLERDAAALRERFNRDFWLDERGHFAFALDGQKRPVDAVASNIGHLLWSGIVDEDRAEPTVRRLLTDDMFTGWGIRSLSEQAAGYSPLGYHTGAVWPHDTAIAAAGMRRYGFCKEASDVACAVIEAAEAFAYRLPEVFAGFARDSTGITIEYPDAERPQAWSAAAPLLAIRTMLGLEIQDGRLRSDPVLPAAVGDLGLRGMTVRGETADAP